LMRAGHLFRKGFLHCKPRVCLAALLLVLAALLASAGGVLLTLAKECCRFSVGEVPEELIREPAGPRDASKQAFALGLPWHCNRLANNWRQRRTWHQAGRASQRFMEGLNLLLRSCVVPLSAGLLTLAKLVQALQLVSRISARWASPRSVSPAGPPLPVRACPQIFNVGVPEQFSRAAAPVLASLKPSFWSQTGAWKVCELPNLRNVGPLEHGGIGEVRFQEFYEEVEVDELMEAFRMRSQRDAGYSDLDGEETPPWGWLALLSRNSELRLLQMEGWLKQKTGSAQASQTIPRKIWTARGPFTKVELLGRPPTLLRCWLPEADKSDKKMHKDLLLPSVEAALMAFSLAAENLSGGGLEAMHASATVHKSGSSLSA